MLSGRPALREPPDRPPRGPIRRVPLGGDPARVEPAAARQQQRRDAPQGPPKRWRRPAALGGGQGEREVVH
eukprot:8200285-Lingulodinium_polyedra.AAC.1